MLHYMMKSSTNTPHWPSHKYDEVIALWAQISEAYIELKMSGLIEKNKSPISIEIVSV